jgi:ribosomal protein L19
MSLLISPNQVSKLILINRFLKFALTSSNSDVASPSSLYFELGDVISVGFYSLEYFNFSLINVVGVCTNKVLAQENSHVSLRTVLHNVVLEYSFLIYSPLVASVVGMGKFLNFGPKFPRLAVNFGRLHFESIKSKIYLKNTYVPYDISCVNFFALYLYVEESFNTLFYLFEKKNFFFTTIYLE